MSTMMAPLRIGWLGDPGLSPRQRVALWIRAAGGVGAIVAGTLMFGAVGGLFTKSQFAVTVGVDAPVSAPALETFKRTLRDAWPGIQFDDAPGLAHGDGLASHGCHGPGTAVVFHANVTRPQFSALFASLGEIASQSGLWLCSQGYRSFELGGSDAPPHLLRAGAPYLALVLAVMLTWWRVGRGRAPFAASRVSPARALAIGVSAGIATAAAINLFGFAALALELTLPTFPVEASRALGAQVWLFVLMVVLIPFVEEFAFRAWFLTLATPAVGAAIATVASGILFSAIHLPSVPVQAVALFLISVAWSVLWYRTGSLLACVTAHGVYNAIFFATQELQ